MNTILLDADEVLLKYNDHFLDYFSVQKEENHTYKTFECMFGKEKLLSMIVDFNSSPYFSSLEPMDGAVEAVHELHKRGYHLKVISSCGDTPDVRFYRRVNLLHVFGDVFDEVELLKLSDSKAPSLRRHSQDAVMWVEDNVKNYHEGLNMGINSFLLLNDFNRNQIQDQRIGVNGWDEILSEFLA